MAQSNYDTSIHAQNVEEITDAEWEIIKLVGRGMSNKRNLDGTKAFPKELYEIISARS